MAIQITVTGGNAVEIMSELFGMMKGVALLSQTQTVRETAPVVGPSLNEPDVVEEKAQAHAAEVAAQAEPPKRGRGRPPKLEVVQAKPTPAPAEATPAPEQPEAPAEVTLEDVTNAMQEVIVKVSTEAAITLFKAFGATKRSELKPEDYADFVAKAREHVAQGR